MKYMQMFESMTHANPKSCFMDDLNQLVFVVNRGEIGKAIGKGGSNIRRMESLLKKKIKVVEYSTDLKQFVKNLIHPVKSSDIVVDGEIVTITSADFRARGLLIGKGASNLRNYENTIKKFFPIKEVKVI